MRHFAATTAPLPLFDTQKLLVCWKQENSPKINRKALNRNISDVAWRRFLQHLAYKAESAGRVLRLVNPRGTTQRCSRCNRIVPKDLEERIHHCPYCGLILDRDLNAALNILALGLQSIGTATQLRPVEAPGFSPGERFRLNQPV